MSKRGTGTSVGGQQHRRTLDRRSPSQPPVGPVRITVVDPGNTEIVDSVARFRSIDWNIRIIGTSINASCEMHGYRRLTEFLVFRDSMVGSAIAYKMDGVVNGTNSNNEINFTNNTSETLVITATQKTIADPT